MKPRRVIITIEAETDLPLAALRRVLYVQCEDSEGFLGEMLRRHDDAVHRIVQLQVGTIKPVSKADMLPKAKRAKGAK